MKHLDSDSSAWLAKLLQEGDIQVESEIQSKLLEYLDRLIERNETINLTRITSERDAVRLHIVDSLVALREVSDAPQGPLVDIGTGGGFPGIALCLASGRDGVLLDSVQKKASAVNEMLHSLDGRISVHAAGERAETHALTHRGVYAVVTARAVSELPALVELASPLLAPGGLLVALKGVPEKREIDRGAAAASRVGMRQASIRLVTLPQGAEQRTILAYVKVAESRLRLPRRVGLAQKSPLG